MLSKEKAYEEMISAKKRGDENFIFKMLYDVMYHQIMVCDEGIPLLEAIIAVFSNKALEQVKGKVKLLTNDLPQNKVLDMNSKADIVASYDNGRCIIEMNSSSIMIVRNNFYAFKVDRGGLKMGNSSYEKGKLFDFIKPDKIYLGKNIGDDYKLEFEAIAKKNDICVEQIR